MRFVNCNSEWSAADKMDLALAFKIIEVKAG